MNEKEYLLNVTGTEGKKMNWDIEMYDPGELIKNNFVVFDNEGDHDIARREVIYSSKVEGVQGIYCENESYDLDVPPPNNEGDECDFKLEANWLDDVPPPNNEGDECDFKLEANWLDKGWF